MAVPATAATPATVKAWAFEGPGYPSCLAQTSIPAPTAASLGATHLLVRMHAVALNPVDIQLMNMPVWHVPLPPFNRTKAIGCDFAGTVLAAGKDAGFAEGDEIFGVSLWQGWNGTFAEVAALDAKSSAIAKKPADWSWEMAAGVSLVWQTARTTIEHAKDYVKQSGGKIAVLGGSSATGMYVVHMAQERGWEVLATCSGKNTDFVKGMGASKVVDYTSTIVPAAVKEFAPDAIIDCVGGTDCLNLAKRYITIVGDKTTRTSMGGALTYLWNPQMFLRWALGRYGFSSVAYDCVNIKMVNAWLEETYKLPHDKLVIDSVYEWDQAKEAFERLNTGRARGKVVVKAKI